MASACSPASSARPPRSIVPRAWPGSRQCAMDSKPEASAGHFGATMTSWGLPSSRRRAFVRGWIRGSCRPSDCLHGCDHEMESLDPADWTDLRVLGHRMIDDMFDHLQSLRDGPVWRPMPQPLRQELRKPLPRGPSSAEAVYQDFQRLVQPYATGNLHPRFMGWVHGGGNPVGMLAELLAAGLNANLGGRDHAPIEMERQVIAWAAEMLGFPTDASGVLVTGTSIANLIGVLVARSASLGPPVRTGGVDGTRLVAYTSAAAHGCLPRAMEMAGLGRDALRLIPCDELGRMRLDALAQSIAVDRANGDRPFLVVGTAGTVDIGAIDELEAIADFAADQSLWFHVDAAFGAIAALAPKLRPLLA